MRLILILALLGLTVYASIRILQVPLGQTEGRPRGQGPRLAIPKRRPLAAESHSSQAELSSDQDTDTQNLREASSRLLIAVIVIAAGASLFIVLVIQWIGRTLDGILSPG